MNVFFQSANSQKLHSNSDLGRIKPRTRAFVKRWLDFFPDSVDQVLLTGCSLARYSNTFTFPLPPADRGFSSPAFVASPVQMLPLRSRYLLLDSNMFHTLRTRPLLLLKGAIFESSHSSPEPRPAPSSAVNAAHATPAPKS